MARKSSDLRKLATLTRQMAARCDTDEARAILAEAAQEFAKRRVRVRRPARSSGPRLHPCPEVVGSSIGRAFPVADYSLAVYDGVLLRI